MLGALQRIRERTLATCKLKQRVGARPKIVVRIREIGSFPNQAHLELASARSLSDARVENRGLFARVRTQDQKRVSLFDSRDRGIEEVGRSTRLGVEGIAALHREVGGTAPGQQ